MKDNTRLSHFFMTNISSQILLLAGLVSVPAYLLQNNLLFQAIQAALFLTAAVLSGKKLKTLPPLILIATITGINLLSPVGKVLFSWGRLSLTAGALSLGLSKALTVIGLVYLSRATVRADLRLPGRFGSVISKTFFYFNKIMETWRDIPKKNIIHRLDLLFTAVDEHSEPSGEMTAEKKTATPIKATTGTGYVLVSLFCVSQWLLFSLQYIFIWKPFTV